MHCSDLEHDRYIGKHFERQFCVMARDYGFMFSPLQIGREGSAVAYKGKEWNRFTLPDVVIWTHPGQHHEIKHKNPTRFGSFGLEEYRLRALLAFARETQQDIRYTIHNHDLSGGREVRENHISHWVTTSVLSLEGNETSQSRGYSWVNGERKKVLIFYWPITLWKPLAQYWGSLL